MRRRKQPAEEASRKRRWHGAVGAGEARRPGKRAARVGSRRWPQCSPLASRPRSPGTRSGRAPRRTSATSRPMPHSRTLSCSLGAARVAAYGSSAWTCGGSWSRSPPPACRSASPSPSPPAVGPVFCGDGSILETARGLSLPGWRKEPLWGPSWLPLRALSGSSEGEQMNRAQLAWVPRTGG